MPEEISGGMLNEVFVVSLSLEIIQQRKPKTAPIQN
jgi:hypothetical protein